METITEEINNIIATYLLNASTATDKINNKEAKHEG